MGMPKDFNITLFVKLVVYMCMYLKSPVVCKNSSCTKYDESIDQRRYSIEYGHKVPDEIYYIFLEGDRCTINATSIYEEMLKRNRLHRISEMRVDLLISCMSPMLVEIVAIDFDSPVHIFLSYSIALNGQCSISLKDLDVLATTGYINILGVGIEGSYIRKAETDIDCSFSETLIDLVITSTNITHWQNGNYRNFTDSLSTILAQCKQPFSVLKSLTLKYSEPMPVSVLAIEKAFPSVANVELENVELNQALTYPWNNELSVMASDFTIKLTTSFIFSRTAVGNLRVQTEPRFNLNGEINLIQISGIYSEAITPLSLANVTHLQKLDFSRNKLVRVFKTWFVNLSKLVSLSIRNNIISIIDNNTFDSMSQLEFLDLSYNRLNHLDVSLFYRMEGLKEIHLEGNLIHSMPSGIFSKQLKTLTGVFIHSNPLEYIPVNLFYAPNLIIYDLHNTSINDQSIVKLGEDLETIDWIQINRSPSHLNIDIHKCQKKIDLSFCNITNMVLASSRRRVLVHLGYLYHSTIILKGNPLHCGCDVNLLTSLCDLSKRELYTSWLCNTPSELKGRNLLTINRSEILCPVNVSHCPHTCTCSMRRDFSSLVVDCKNSSMTEMPDSMPRFDFNLDLELLFRSSLIERLQHRNYFGNVTVLDLSQCRLHAVEPAAFRSFKILKRLHLDSNLLSTLPEQMMNITVTKLTLNNNPFLCDCRLLWMKTWLLQSDTPVSDREEIKCTDGSEKGKLIIGVNDAMFVCRSESFDHLKHLVMPSMIIGSLSLAIVVSAVVVFFQSAALKVLLYVYCGAHPFDKDNSTTEARKYDATVIYSLNDKNFMREHVVIHLKEKGYRIADMYEDFIIGKSFNANIEYLINSSRRLILCVSTYPFENDIIQSAWHLAYDKTLRSQANFIILILSTNVASQVTDSSIKKFVKYGRYIGKDSRMFLQKLFYVMPGLNDQHEDSQERLELIDRFQQEDTQPIRIQTTTFVTYPDRLHNFVRHRIIPELENNGHTVRIFEYEFTAGNSQAEEIITLMDQSRHLIYIMSEETLRDEWKTVILKQAIVKTMASDYNYLLLFTHGRIREELLIRTPEICKYISSYATICTDHEDFMKLLLLAMSAEL